MKRKTKRRDFIKTSMASLAGLSIVPRHVLGGKGYIPPSDELTRAIIGVGGMGRGHIGYTGARLLAVCDVDKNHLQMAMNQAGGNVRGYEDYREVLQRTDIDIIHIATPPHWHGIMAYEAARAGKDIWCEKPMTRTIGEGLKVVKAVQDHQRIFRLNTWFRFRANFYGLNTRVKPVKKLVDSGLLGWPLKVTVSGITGFNWKFYWKGETNLKTMAIPESLNYKMWLGPAPYKPYNPERVHSKFRGYWDYDGGGLGDMGQHYLDPVQYILGKDHTSPVKVEVDAPQQHYDAVGTWRKIVMTYADGCQIILDGIDADKHAAYIEGPGGKVYKGFKSDIPDLDKKLAAMPDPEPQLGDFHEAVRTRQKFALNEDNGNRSCTLVNLGKIALRLGRSVEFDPDKQEFVNDPGANALIHQPMNSPWQF